MRAAIRSLRAARSLSIGGVACVALGAAAVASVATIVEATLVRPLPFPDARRLVRIWFEEPGVNPRVPLSIPDVRDVAKVASFDLLLATARVRIVAQSGSGAERLRGEAVSPGYFEALDVHAIRGRLLNGSDTTAGAWPVMVVSHRLWVNRFGADASVTGTSIRTENALYTIVGVAPASFGGTVEDDVVDFWVPLAQYEPAAFLNERAERPAWAIGRLAPGVTPRAAEMELAALGARLASDYPRTHRRLRLRLESMGENWRSPFRRTAWLLVAAASLLLAVALVNVAGSMLARVLDRRRELAVRTALGARPRQLVAQLVLETLLIVAAGTVLGLTAAPWILAAMLRLSPVALPGYVHANVNMAVLLASCVLLAVAGTLAARCPP